MEFYKQALELDKKPFGFMAELETTHPLTVNRIRQAVRYYRSEDYRRIAAMQGKAGTSTLQGSLETGDLLKRILEKPDKKQVKVSPRNTAPVKGTAQELCKNCGSARKGNAPFCVTCGAKFEQANLNTQPVRIEEEDIVTVIQVVEEAHKYCINCGAKNLKQASFCTECGEKF